MLKALIVFVLLGASAQASAAVVVRPRLADRFYIGSVLNELFGPSANEIVRRMILEHDTVIGGPCDLYESVRTGPAPADLEDPRRRCVSGKAAMSLPMVPHANLMREAYISKACESLSNESEAIRYFLTKHVATRAAPDAENITKAFQSFNPTRRPSPAVVEALEKVAQTSNSWRHVIMTLCIDPLWREI